MRIEGGTHGFTTNHRFGGTNIICRQHFERIITTKPLLQRPELGHPFSHRVSIREIFIAASLLKADLDAGFLG